jgi:hypothetical protein
MAEFAREGNCEKQQLAIAFSTQQSAFSPANALPQIAQTQTP